MPWKALWSALKLSFEQRKSGQQLDRALETNSAIDEISRAYSAGDYTAALAASEGLRVKGAETGDYCFYQGALRRHLRQPDEAERWLRKALTMTRDQRLSALQAEALGEALLEGERYGAAREAFERSLELAPERGSSDRGIAESWLRQGDDNATALARAEVAVQKQRSLPAGGAAGLNLGEDLALLAWAVAAADRDSRRVISLAAEAVALCPPEQSVPSAAQVNFHLGCAYAVLSDEPNSEQHYRQTARLDRQGHWGAVAQRVLGGEG